MFEQFKSFLFGYIPIPLVFYAVDMICQEAFVEGGLFDIALLTVILTLVSGGLFSGILRQKKFPVSSPGALAFGASLGLWHFFTLYQIVGSYWVWKTAPTRHLNFTLVELKYFWMSFVNPVLNVDDWQCDGSLGAVLLSVTLFAGIVLMPKLGKIKK